jgi:hypothetical protein
MNTKVITFSVFAVIFIGAAVGCYSLGCETLADTSEILSVAFVVAAFLSALVDVCRNLKLCCLNGKMKKLKAELDAVKKTIEEKTVPVAQPTDPEKVAEQNKELQNHLGKLAEIGESLNRIQEGIKRLETAKEA